MTVSPRVRRLALTAHVTASVGWLGALAVFLVHAAVSWAGRDAETVWAADLAMGLTAWFVILPFSIASLTTGVIQALGTQWGLFRHYWVLAKLLLTLLATVVLLLKLGPINHLANAAAQGVGTDLDLSALRTSILVHAMGGLVVLLAATALAVYKPSGQLGDSADMVAGMPVWVKIFGLITAIFVLLILAMILWGGHGPSAHIHNR